MIMPLVKWWWFKYNYTSVHWANDREMKHEKCNRSSKYVFRIIKNSFDMGIITKCLSNHNKLKWFYTQYGSQMKMSVL